MSFAGWCFHRYARYSVPVVLTVGLTSVLLREVFRPKEWDPTPCGVNNVGVTVDEHGQFTGQGIEGQDTFVPLSAAIARPRRRAIWVRRLEAFLGLELGCVGRFLRGRWEPDLISQEGNSVAASLLERFPYGAKILGGGSVRAGVDKPGAPQSVGYLVFELPDGSREVLFPELHNQLSTYSLFRKRDAILVSALRSRAEAWCKDVGLTKSDTWTAVSSSVHLVWQVSRRERYASEALFASRTTRFWWSSS